MNSYIVSIVGAGAASLSFINSLRKIKTKDDNYNLIINVFDDNPQFGRGNAYDSDLKSNLMNTKALYLTYDEDKPGDFLNWLGEKNIFPIHYTGESYVPRSLFGDYMHEKWEEVTAESISKQININKMNYRVSSVKREGNKFEIIGKNGNHIISDYVILASGTSTRTVDSRYYGLPISIIETPYPVSHLLRKVGDSQCVVIIGARLSAIDSVIALKESGYTGKIIMHCINGTFPTIRGTQGRYKNKFLSYEYISLNFKNHLTFEKIIDLYKLELKNYQRNRPTCENEDVGNLINQYPISNLACYLEKEIASSKKDRAWQAIFYDTNQIIPLLWSLIKEEDKQIFLNSLLNKLTALRVSIPLENAIKIQSYVADGSLVYSSGAFDFCKHEGIVKFLSDAVGTQENVGAIIFATGSPANPLDSSSILSNQLISDGILSLCEWGGVLVDRDYHPYNSRGERVDSFFVIGDLTKGRDMFVAALDIIRRQAHECALSFISTVEATRNATYEN